MEQADQDAIYARAQAELGKIPGVLHVGFGLKEVDGRTTEQIAFRVYVREKKPEEALAPAEIVPAEFEGIPTDVLLPRQIERDHCEDMQLQSPLMGGISITNARQAADGTIGVGTLGFFATLDGAAGPKNVVLVSNNHVLGGNATKVGDEIKNIGHDDVAGTITPTLDRTALVGAVNHVGLDGHHPFAYPGDATATDYYLDCASALLDICISSWCDTNCGVSYKNEIKGLAIIPPPPAPQVANSKIEGFARAVKLETVYKVGRTTARTKGRIVEISALGNAGEKGLIEVEPLEPDCDGNNRFSASGDSGAALVNEKNQIVGLHFGSGGGHSFSCHIHVVMDLLKITPISTQNPPVPPAGKARADVRGFIDGINETIPLRERFVATRLGQTIYEEVVAQREEVVALVNHHRPVTVAWHRGKGPAFVAHGVENVRNPAHRVPREIEGVDRAALARRIAAALHEHGSPSLQRAMDRWLPFVLDHVDDFDSLHDFVDKLEREPVNA